MIGRIVAGRFVVESLLGRGGMGSVYRARDGKLRRAVALKLLSDELAADADLKERFLREARLGARLDHPHVVRVIDAGDWEGHPYLAMELVDGEELGAYFDRVRTERPEAGLRRLAEVADALAHAHGLGIVHRDLKGGNVLVGRDEEARVLDWGLARSTVDSSGLTRTGILLGTPGSMAPEQIRGEKAGPAADGFALGVMLHELLYGSRPFRGDSIPELLKASLVGGRDLDLPTPPGHHSSTVFLLRRLLEARPEDRPSAAEARDLLRELAEKEAVSVPVRGKAGRGGRTRALPVAEGAPTRALDGVAPAPTLPPTEERPRSRTFLLLPLLLLGGLVLVGLHLAARRSVPSAAGGRTGPAEEGRLFKEALLSPDGRSLTLRFAGPREGRVELRFESETGAVVARPAGRTVALGGARTVSRRDSALDLPLEDPPWEDVKLRVVDGGTSFLFELPGALRGLELVDRLKGPAMIEFHRALTKVRPLLTAWDRALSADRVDEARRTKSRIDALWSTLPVEGITMDRLREIGRVLDVAPAEALRPGSELARRLLPLRWGEGLLGTGGHTPSPWGSVTRRMGIRFRDGGGLDPEGTWRSEGWRTLAAADLFQDYGRGKQCIWLNPRSAPDAPPGMIDYHLQQKLQSAAETILGKGDDLLPGETIRDVELAPRSHTWTFDLNERPARCLLVLEIRYFPHDHALRIELNDAPPVELVECARFLEPAQRGTLEPHRWFVPCEARHLAAKNRLRLSDDGIPDNERPMDIVAIKGLALWGRD